jgi:hypothetical protein
MVMATWCAGVDVKTLRGNGAGGGYSTSLMTTTLFGSGR